MNFPRPMLNSPTRGTAAGDAFYASVVRRVAAWQDLRDAYIKMAHLSEIVRQIDICIAEITPHLDRADLAQMLLTTPIEEIETLLKRLQKMRPPVQ